MLVYRAEVFPVDVGVDLGSGEVRVPQHFLDGAEIGSTLEQMGGKAVPKRVQRNPLADGCRLGRLMEQTVELRVVIGLAHTRPGNSQRS